MENTIDKIEERIDDLAKLLNKEPEELKTILEPHLPKVKETVVTPEFLEQLNKKLDVIKVKTFAEEQSISRELMLVKVKYNKNNRRDIMEICDIMKADIVDMSKHFMILQICDLPERTKLLINMLQSISIVEVARTGTLALPKCADSDN